MPSVTTVHLAKAVRRNEMPLGRDADVVPSNTVLDRGLGPMGRGDMGVRKPSSHRQGARSFPTLIFHDQKNENLRHIGTTDISK